MKKLAIALAAFGCLALAAPVYACPGHDKDTSSDNAPKTAEKDKKENKKATPKKDEKKKEKEGEKKDGDKVSMK